MRNIQIAHKNKSLFLFHINACSLNKNFDGLQHLLTCTKKRFDIIAINETIITKEVSSSNNLNLNYYSFEFTASETSAGGTLLYIAKHLSYKCLSDLNIYKKNELESTFIEILNPRKSNIIVGVICRYPSMDLADFNCNYLNKLLENTSKEQKPIFLLGDFNVNHLNYNEHVIDPGIISGNLTATISDHLPQSVIIPNMFGNISGNKSNIYERHWSKFDRENFIPDYFSVGWEDFLKIDELNVDNSTKIYLDKLTCC